MSTWNIRWNMFDTAYVKGSSLRSTTSGEIEFSHELMSPGSVIHTWYSRTHYQTQRTEPTLPLLVPNTKYSLALHARIKGRGKAIVHVQFYDRFDHLIDQIFMRTFHTTFVCPPGMQYYTISLVNGGIERIAFTSLEISDE